MEATASCRSARRHARATWMMGLLCAGCGASAHAARHDALQRELDRSAAVARGDEHAAPFAGDAALSRAALVREVLARNPGVASSREAFRAALARHEARGALPDPMLEYELAPLSIFSDEMPFGQTVRLSQRFPWPGKLSLEAEAALAEAEAAREDHAAVRQRLALMASTLYDRYYALGRSLARTAEHDALVREIGQAATAQYEAGLAPRHEALQADVELAQVERQRIVFEAEQRVVAAQLNGLLHRAPGAPLPPPPSEVALGAPVDADVDALLAEALEARPELRASSARIGGRRAMVSLADRESYPDLGVMGSYSSMWQATEHQWMVGVSVNLPIQLDARDAQVRAARASLASEQASLEAMRSEVAVELESARQRLIQSVAVVEHYHARLLPAARAQIDAARSAYEAGRGSFQALVDAERSLRTLELERELVVAEHGGARAALEHALGRTPGLWEGGAP